MKNFHKIFSALEIR